MPRYQLRLPASHDLESWLDEVTWIVWDELMHHAALEPLAPHAFVRIREILMELLERHVTTYRSCGLWSYCLAGTTPSPWMPSEAFRPASQEGRVVPRPPTAAASQDAHWYILEVARGLEELVAEATDRIGELLFRLLKTPAPRGVIEANLETALRRGVGRYLYQNPHCGTSPFCQGRVPISPWRRHGDEVSLTCRVRV